jgi:apolipoprotein N-acyltransferase
LGNGFVNSPQLIQWYEFTGVLGGSLWIMLSNVMGYHVVAYLLRKQEKSGLLLLAGWVVLVGLPMWFSFNLYNKYPLDSGKFLNVVVLQPDVDPYTEKFSGLSYESQVQLLDSLMVSAITDKTELILAPETALPEMDEDSISSNKLLNRLAKSLQNYPKTSLIIGAITNKSSDFGVSIEGNPIKSYNSAILINSSSEAQVSHKTILVAGVEKQPFHEYFSFLPSILLSVGGDTRALEAGVKPVVLKTKSGGEIAPVICFESVFGDYVRTIVGDGANCIAVLTNDGWWKASSGVWQHFGYSGIRAIENRRSVVRSANTGISGCFNPRGDEIVKSFTGTNCTLSCAVELNNQLTFYVVHGDYLGWGSLLLSILVITHALVIKQKKSALIRM